MARRARSASKRGFKLSAAIIATVLLLIAAGAGILFQLGQGGPVASAGDDVAAAGAQQASGPFHAIENGFKRLVQMWSATDRIAELEREKQELEISLMLASRLAERNQRYEELLNMQADAFGSQENLDKAVGAQLVLDSGGPFKRTLVANAGADHGVKVGYIAVNQHGLVGRVVSVGRRSARILLLDDYNSRIPVMGEQSRVRAVLVGQAADPPDLVTRPFAVESPRLEYASAGLRENEPVITSGDGGLFPRGLRVGYANNASGGWRVDLAASQQPIDFVRIIPYEPPVTPERDELIDDPGPPVAPPSAAASVARGQSPPPQAPRRRVEQAAPAQAPPPAPTPAAAQPEAAPPGPPQ